MGVQGLSGKISERRSGRDRQQGRLGAKTGPVDAVSDHGMADRGQMDADLMRAAGLEPAGEQAGHGLAPSVARSVGSAKALAHLPMGNRLARAFAHRHAVAGARVTADRPVDAAARALRRAPDEGEIAALERSTVAAVAGELRRERPVRAIVLRYHHEAGRIFVEPVHDAGPALAADAGQAVAAMG